VWLSWRRQRTDRVRAAALLWGGWLIVTGLVFSYMSGIIHPYYTVALAPAIGALAGVGAATLWRARRSMVAGRLLAARAVLAGALVVTAGWAYVLLGRSPGWLPWLRPLVLVCGLAAAAVLIAERWLPGRAVLLSLAPLALVASLAGPLAYSLDRAHWRAAQRRAVRRLLRRPGWRPRWSVRRSSGRDHAGRPGFGRRGCGRRRPARGRGSRFLRDCGRDLRPPAGEHRRACPGQHRRAAGAVPRRPGRRHRWRPGWQHSGLQRHHEAADQRRLRLSLGRGHGGRGECGPVPAGQR
jgi:hypothetical protein